MYCYKVIIFLNKKGKRLLGKPSIQINLTCNPEMDIKSVIFDYVPEELIEDYRESVSADCIFEGNMVKVVCESLGFSYLGEVLGFDNGKAQVYIYGLDTTILFNLENMEGKYFKNTYKLTYLTDEELEECEGQVVEGKEKKIEEIMKLLSTKGTMKTLLKLKQILKK